jgi:hypothetical protein
MNYDLQNIKSIVVTTGGITRQLIAINITHIISDSYLCDIYTE